MTIKTKFREGFTLVAKLFFISFITTLIFLLLVWILERFAVFAIIATVNEEILYYGEAGGFFFALILISFFLVEILRYFAIERK